MGCRREGNQSSEERLNPGWDGEVGLEMVAGYLDPIWIQQLLLLLDSFLPSHDGTDVEV